MRSFIRSTNTEHHNVPGTMLDAVPGRKQKEFTRLHGLPCDSDGKESSRNVGGLGLIPGLGRSPGEGNSYPLQYSGPEKSMDSIVHGITKSWTRLSHFKNKSVDDILVKQTDNIQLEKESQTLVSAVSKYKPV